MAYLNSDGGNQTWPRLRHLLPKFETALQVDERESTLVKHLTAGDNAARNVGRKLRRCRKNKPCLSSTCHKCLRQLRKSFITGAMQAIDQVLTINDIPDDQIVGFSAVLAEERYADGDLHNADLEKINKRVQRRHQRAAFPLIFAGVDISWNEDNAGRWAPHWQLQVYGVCIGIDMVEVRRRLAKQFPASNTTPKPLRVRRCKNLPKALSYMIKPYFGRRVSYIDDTGRFNTRKVPLKRPQAQEVATWIDHYPLTARYALTGCRRYGNRIEPTR